MADDAQLKVALTHYLQREKADRDNTQALLAEAELKAMIQTYPDSNLLDEAKDRLRDIQEVLAAGVYGVADFYHLRKAYPAAIDRYKEILMKYPDSARVPESLFFLADSLQKSDNSSEAGIYFARLVSEHPLSNRVKDAKERLTALNMPIPEPNPVALARAQQSTREGRSILGKMVGMFSRRPPGSSETAAASSPDQPEPEKPGESSGTGAEGTFTVDPKVVQPVTQKPR